MSVTSIITTVKDIFSGDNSKLDFTHVNSGFWIFAILGMWLYKSYTAGPGVLCDIPPAGPPRARSTSSPSKREQHETLAQ